MKSNKIFIVFSLNFFWHLTIQGMDALVLPKDECKTDLVALHQSYQALPADVQKLIAFWYYKPTYLPTIDAFCRINQEEEYSEDEIQKVKRWKQGLLSLKVFDLDTQKRHRTGSTSNRVNLSPIYVVGPNEMGQAAVKNKKAITIRQGKIDNRSKFKQFVQRDTTGTHKYCFDDIQCVHPLKGIFAGIDFFKHGLVAYKYKDKLTKKINIPNPILGKTHEYLKMQLGYQEGIFLLEDTTTESSGYHLTERNFVFLDYKAGNILHDFPELRKLKSKIMDFSYCHFYPNFLLIRLQGDNGIYNVLYSLISKKYTFVSFERNFAWKGPLLNLQKQHVSDEEEKEDIDLPATTLEVFDAKQNQQETERLAKEPTMHLTLNAMILIKAAKQMLKQGEISEENKKYLMRELEKAYPEDKELWPKKAKDPYDQLSQEIPLDEFTQIEADQE